MSNGIRYVGLDFEASGANPWDRNVPIQIGLAIHSDESPWEGVFGSLIGRWNWKEWEWNEVAAQVHNIDRDSLASERPVWQVDIAAAAWLLKHGFGQSRMYTISVGWNVAGYDRQFITRWMPNLNRVLSYRTLDLNALCLGLAGDSVAEYKAIKGEAKDYANRALGITEQERHDAVWDAKAALFEKEYLVGRSLLVPE